MKLDVFKYNQKYFIGIVGDMAVDADIANDLKISLDHYQNTLIEFGGFIKDTQVLFKSKESIMKAMEWVESVYIASKLTG